MVKGFLTARAIVQIGHFVRPKALPSVGPTLFLFQIETDCREALAILDGASHLSALRKIARAISRDDVRIKRMATSFTVSVLIV